MTLDALSTFVAIAEAGSMAKAAKRCGIPTSTLSRQLAQLEARLGLRLIQRSTRAMRLTPDGEQLYAQAAPSVHQLDEALAQAAAPAREPEGLLRLTAPTSFGRLVLTPLIAEYMARYPKVEVEALLVDRRVNLIEEGYDLAFRMGDLPDSALVARTVAIAERLFCASPAYLQRTGTPQTPDDLPRHRLLGFAREPQQLTLSHEDGSRHALSLRWHLLCSPPDGLLPSLLSGQGIALIPGFLVYEALHQGQLVRVLPHWHLPRGEIHLVYPSARGVSRKVASFIEMAVPCLAQDERFRPPHSNSASNPPSGSNRWLR